MPPPPWLWQPEQLNQANSRCPCAMWKALLPYSAARGSPLATNACVSALGWPAMSRCSRSQAERARRGRRRASAANVPLDPRPGKGGVRGGFRRSRSKHGVRRRASRTHPQPLPFREGSGAGSMREGEDMEPPSGLGLVGQVLHRVGETKSGGAVALVELGG